MGANDGILSIGALLVGVAGADIGRRESLIAAFAGLAAGAGSMAMGEYVSVSAEKDTFDAEHELEAHELAEDPVGETEELRSIYQKRGLPHGLAAEVAEHLMAHDPLGAHMRDELGYTDTRRPRPIMAAVSSFISFCLGALVPIAAAALATDPTRGIVTALATLGSLLVLGALAAQLGGSSITRGAVRVCVGGLLALVLSHLAGNLIGSAAG